MNVKIIKPKVSIIIPVFNGSNYIEEAILSALSQSYENIEIIVINDGSTDNNKTEEICLKYADKIKYYKKSNGGVSSALNLGLEKMEGSYFSWLSHDDLYYKDKVLKQIEELEKYSFDKKYIAYTKMDLINAKGQIIRKGKPLKSRILAGEKLLYYIAKNSLNGCGMLISKELLDEIGGFDVNYRYIQDLKAWILLAFNDNNLSFINDVLTSTRIHGEQHTVKLFHLLKQEREKLINELIENNNNSIEQIKFIINFGIKVGLWNKTKKFYKDNQYRINYTFRLSIYFKRAYYYLIRKFKKIYWKLKRK